jgi:hypothetical protein
MCYYTVSPLPRRDVTLLESQQLSRQSSITAKRPRGGKAPPSQGQNDPSLKQKFSVSFSEIIETMGESDTKTEDVPKTWYGPKDLERFKNQARDYVFGRSIGADTELRGYERYNVVTAKKKAMTRQVTLLACSQKGLSPDDVAAIVHRSTKWAVNDAFRTGCHDYCHVYHPELMDVCSSIGKRSRNHDDEGTPQRNIKRRIVPSNRIC